MPKGANRPTKRYGRGSGSGHGKTSGRGHKGARARTGSTLQLGFEGGQMSFIRRLPKRGFVNVNPTVYQIVNVGTLNHFKKDSVVDRIALKESGVAKSKFLPIKILGDGKLSKPLSVIADAFSESAKKKIVEAGGKVELAVKAVKKD